MRAIVAGLLLSCVPLFAGARSFAIDDLLALEGYGQVLQSPDGQITIVERRNRYDGAARFTYGFLTRRATSRVMVFDPRSQGGLIPAFSQEPRAGYWAGSFSPKGTRLTVFRLSGDRLQLGVVDVARREVRWIEGAPDLPLSSPAPIWIDERRFIHLRFRHQRLPLVLDVGERFQKTSARYWKDQAAGVVSTGDLANTRFEGIVEEDRRELVLTDIEAGSERILASGEITDFQLSPDNRQAQFVLLGEAVAPDRGIPVTASYVGRRRRLRLVDVATGAVSAPCWRCDMARVDARYSEDGRLAFVARRDGEEWGGAKNLVLAADGRQISTLSGAAGNRLEWSSSVLFVQRGQRWTLLGRGVEREIGGLGRLSPIAADGNQIWFSNERGVWRAKGEEALVRVFRGRLDQADLDFLDQSSTGTLRLRHPGAPIVRTRRGDVERVMGNLGSRGRFNIDIPAGAELLSVNDVDRSAIVLTMGADGVGTLRYVARGKKAKTIDVTSSHLREVETPRSLPIKRTIRGQPVVDWLFLPHGDGPAATVVFPYQGAIYGAAAPAPYGPGRFTPYFSVSLLTAKGFAVLIPSLPNGPAGRPQDALIADLDEAVDAAVRTGRVDPDRMAIFGHSYGGMNALTIAARSGRYRAILSSSGITEMAALYGFVPPALKTTLVGGAPLDAGIGWFETGQAQMGVAPWVDPERYLRASPLFEADRIRSPLLLIAKDLDYAPMEQAERLFAGMTRLGREVTLLRFFGEGHVLQSPANIRFQWSSMLDFLNKHLARRRSAADGSGPAAKPALNDGIVEEGAVVGSQAESVGP